MEHVSKGKDLVKKTRGRKRKRPVSVNSLNSTPVEGKIARIVHAKYRQLKINHRQIQNSMNHNSVETSILTAAQMCTLGNNQ